MSSSSSSSSFSLLLLLLLASTLVSVLSIHNQGSFEYLMKPGSSSKWFQTSSCLNYTTCDSCIQGSNCGWCADTLKCVPGTSSGPNEGSCSTWDWTQCPGGPPPPAGSSYSVNFEFTGLSCGVSGVCDKSEYCCTDSTCWTTGSNGTLTFFDQTPNGKTPDAVSLFLNGALICVSLNTTYQFFLNQQFIQQSEYQGIFDCQCTLPCHNFTMDASIASGTIFQGGRNTLGIQATAGVSCLDNAALTVYYH